MDLKSEDLITAFSGSLWKSIYEILIKCFVHCKCPFNCEIAAVGGGLREAKSPEADQENALSEEKAQKAKRKVGPTWGQDQALVSGCSGLIRGPQREIRAQDHL